MIVLLATLYLLIGLISAVIFLAANPNRWALNTWLSLGAVTLLWPLVILFGFVLHLRGDR